MSAHNPIVRPLPLDFYRNEHKEWVAIGYAPKLCEIVCPQCGDDSGPKGDQSEAVQRLRGPFPNAQALEVAELHMINPEALPV